MAQSGSLKGNKECNELNENENTTYKDVQDTAKAVLRGNCIAVNEYNRKEERSQISI